MPPMQNGRWRLRGQGQGQGLGHAVFMRPFTLVVVSVAVAELAVAAAVVPVVPVQVTVAVHRTWLWVTTLLPCLVEVVATHASTVVRWLQATARTTWQRACHYRRMYAMCWTRQPCARAVQGWVDTRVKTVVCTVDFASLASVWHCARRVAWRCEVVLLI